MAVVLVLHFLISLEMNHLATGEASNRLRLYFFGLMRIERGNRQVRLPTRKLESLLAYLVVHPGPQSREKLAALCWGEFSDAQARASLRNAIALLRKHLGHRILLADRNLVQLNPNYPLWVDALDFQAQAKQFLSAPSPNPNTVNLDLYAGDFLIELYDDWVLAERERITALYVETLLRLTQLMRAQSEYELALKYAQQVLACDAANEHAHQHLIFCYVALGDRSAALRQYEACRRSLQDELAVEPSPETKMLHRWIQQAPVERTSIEASITNLPHPLSSFVGRQREKAEIKNLVSTTRLLTLTGAGGSGKTRLSIQVAIGLLDAFKDGVWWADLAPLRDEQLVARTVAKALGVSEVPNQSLNDLLVNFLRQRQLLLVLDNCEHLSAACAELAERLLSTCVHMRILATSREALGVTGEHVWYVPTLSVPDPEQALRVDQLNQYESVRLFVARATAVNSDFELTEANAVHVAHVCWRLDGMPLALELAAARVKVLTVEQIASRLDDAFRLLASGSRTGLARHQTLHAAIGWSYELLSEKERALFRRLSAFAGGWTLEAAEAICAGEGIEGNEVFDLLSRLVDKSLVEMQDQGREARFRMLQTIQQYSRERLLESGESGRIHNRHLDYFLRLVEAAKPHLGYFLSDIDMGTWLARLEAENDNLRAALYWSLEKENGPQASAEAGLRLAGNLHWFWFVRGHFSEGRGWLARLLELTSEVSTAMKAQALLTAGYLACWQGDFAAGHAPLEQALTLFRRLEDQRSIAFAQHGLGFVALGEGNPILSRFLFEEAVREAREVGDKWLTAFSLHFLAIVITNQGDYAQASMYFEEGNAILQEIGGHRQGLAFSLFHLARIARLQGDYSKARLRHAEGMQLFQQIGDRRGIGYSLAGLAVLAVAQADMQRAARLSGAVTSLQAVLGSFLEAPLQIEYDREIGSVRSTLGEESFQSAWKEGRTMTIDQAIEYALKG